MIDRLLHPMPLFGAADGAYPAGLMHKADAIDVVPGTTRTVDGQPLSEIWDELLAMNAAYNMVGNRMLSLITYPVDRAADQVGVPSNPGFQEATEFGRPTNIRIKYVTRGYPLDHFDLGYGYTQEFIDRAKGRELLAIQSEVELAYERLLLGKVLGAIFTENNSTDQDGVLVKRLYNGDGEIPPNWMRWTFDGNHTHYLTSGAATFDAADVLAMETHLVHHGFNGSFYLHMNRDEVATARGLTGFVPAVTSDIPAIVNGIIVGPTPTSGEGGFVPFGYQGKFALIENNEIPSGYLFAHVSGGTNNPRNPVGLRSHENSSAQGLRLVEGPRQRYPIIDAVYDTYTGAGVGQRGSAVVMQVTAGSYTDPTF